MQKSWSKIWKITREGREFLVLEEWGLAIKNTDITKADINKLLSMGMFSEKFLITFPLIKNSLPILEAKSN